MLAQEVFRKYILVCDRNNEIDFYETFLLYQRHVFDVPSSVKCCMYYVFHHTPHSVPAGQIDCFLNVTIKVHHEKKNLLKITLRKCLSVCRMVIKKHN